MIPPTCAKKRRTLRLPLSLSECGERCAADEECAFHTHTKTESDAEGGDDKGTCRDQLYKNRSSG